jgi:hypothetical protein
LVVTWQEAHKPTWQKHKKCEMKGTFNKKGAKNQSWSCMTVLGMKWSSVKSANKGNRSNNLGGTIMAVAG